MYHVMMWHGHPASLHVVAGERGATYSSESGMYPGSEGSDVAYCGGWESTRGHPHPVTEAQAARLTIVKDAVFSAMEVAESGDRAIGARERLKRARRQMYEYEYTRWVYFQSDGGVLSGEIVPAADDDDEEEG